MGRITINYFSLKTEPVLLCDTVIPSTITVTRPTDTPGSGWTNENLESGVALSGDMYFEFTVGTHTGATPQMIGLDSDDPNTSYNTLDYCLYLYDNGTSKLLRIYENGSLKVDLGITWVVGDVLAIRRTGTTIDYIYNGTVVATTLNDAGNDLQIGSSFYYVAGFWGTGSITLNNISLCQV